MTTRAPYNKKTTKEFNQCGQNCLANRSFTEIGTLHDCFRRGVKVKTCVAPLVHHPSMTLVISCHLPLSEAHSISFFVEDKVKLKSQKAFDHVHCTYITRKDVRCAMLN